MESGKQQTRLLVYNTHTVAINMAMTKERLRNKMTQSNGKTLLRKKKERLLF